MHPGSEGAFIVSKALKPVKAAYFLGVLYLVVSCRTDYSILMFVECFIPNVRGSVLTFAGVLFDEAIAVVEPVYHQEDIAYDI